MDGELLDKLQLIEEDAKELWRGRGCDVGVLNRVVYDTARIILDIAEQLPEEDQFTTVNYIKGALSDFENACNKRDDFLLADCLYFEWREIILIFVESNVVE